MMTYRFSRTRYLVCHIITIMSNLTITFVLTELKTTPENCPDFPDWSSGAARSTTMGIFYSNIIIILHKQPSSSSHKRFLVILKKRKLG